MVIGTSHVKWFPMDVDLRFSTEIKDRLNNAVDLLSLVIDGTKLLRVANPGFDVLNTPANTSAAQVY